MYCNVINVYYLELQIVDNDGQGGLPQQSGGWDEPPEDHLNYQDYPPVEEDGPPQISADLSDIAR